MMTAGLKMVGKDGFDKPADVVHINRRTNGIIDVRYSVGF